jgi:hypothetical protein
MAIEQWFEDVVRRFRQSQEDLLARALFQSMHCRRVRMEMDQLSREVGLTKAGRALAGLLGMIHGLGRFEPATAHVCVDASPSEDPADLAMTILEQEGVLPSLPPPTRCLLSTAISYQRRPAIPADETDSAVLLYSRLLRDADKLASWQGAIEEYEKANGDRNPRLRRGLMESPGCTLQVRTAVVAGRAVDEDDLRNVNDLRLLQLSWVYQVHFQATLEHVRIRQIPERIMGSLRGCGNTQDIASSVQSFLQTRLEQGTD